MYIGLVITTTGGLAAFKIGSLNEVQDTISKTFANNAHASKGYVAEAISMAERYIPPLKFTPVQSFSKHTDGVSVDRSSYERSEAALTPAE